MSHIHKLQFIENGGVQCSTLNCPVYYSEEHIIQILERLANENASQQSFAVAKYCPQCGNKYDGVLCGECGFTTSPLR